MENLIKKLMELRELAMNMSNLYVIKELKKIYSENENFPYKNILNQAQDTMSFMLEYYEKQFPDPQRKDIFSKVQDDILFVIDGLIENQKSITANEPRSIYWNKTFVKNVVGYLTTGKLNEQEKNNLFMGIWMTDRFDKAIQSAIKQYMSNKEVPDYEKVVLVSAISLSLWRIFEIEKFKIIVEFCKDENVEISSRAIVAILITLFLYEKRIVNNKETNKLLTDLLKDPQLADIFNFSVLQHIKTLNTEDVIKMFQNDILPEMMKLQSELKDVDMLNIEDLQEMMDDENPGWNDEKNNNMEFLEKMENFTMKQFEGADIYSPTLGKMKNFSFFRSISNWLLPFSAKNPDVRKAIEVLDEDIREDFITIISESNIFCNSDKYSFCFHFSELPSMLQGNVAKIMIEQLSAADELGKASYDEEESIRPLIVHYFQDLYRFFNFNNLYIGYENIFDSKFGIHNTNFFDKLPNESNILRTSAELYMKQKMYLPAALTFEKATTNTPNIELFEKTGYCFQKLKLFNRALEFYTKAELLGDDKKWLLKKLAFSYMKLKNYEKAIDYYKLAEKQAEEDVSIQVNMGSCYIYKKQYEEALQCFFKADYYKPDQIRNLRSIAFCYFKTDKFDDAVKYAQKCIEKKADKVDLFIMGCISWINGDFQEAFDYYFTAMNDYEDITKFFNDFSEYHDFLKKHKISDIDINLINELLIKHWDE